MACELPKDTESNELASPIIHETGKRSKMYIIKKIS
jgi:hypothetical protein